MELHSSIEQLYHVFSKYEQVQMGYCTCGCIPNYELPKPYSKPLRELTEDDLGFYAHKAMTTWGVESDFKFYLPRLLELFSLDVEDGIIDTIKIRAKLIYGQWRSWPSEEQKAVTVFLIANWKNHLKTSKIIHYHTFEDYSQLIPEEQLIDLWPFQSHETAFLSLLEFINWNQNKLFEQPKVQKAILGTSIKQIIEHHFLTESELDLAPWLLPAVHQTIEMWEKLHANV